MEIAIVGAGAVGLGLASALGSAHDLFVVARGEAARALRSRGLARSGLYGERHIAGDRLHVVESIAGLRGASIDWVLVCTKTFSSDVVAAELAAIRETLPERAHVVLFHNGWGTADVFARHWPRERVCSARVITGFRLLDRTTSEITVSADAIRVGSLFGSAPAALADLCAAIDWGGIPCAVSTDVSRELWSKLLYNCAFNPLGALCGVPYGALGERAATRAVIARVVDEVFRVMRAEGRAAHWEEPEAYLRELYEVLLPPTASHESSMLVDLRAGRPTEIEAITGSIVRLAAKHGLSAPTNDALRTLVLAIEARA